MKSNYFAGIDQEQGPRLEIASLIDMSFLMLVFFMVNCGYRFVFFFTPLKTLKAAGVYREYGFPFQLLWAAGGILFMTFF